MFGLFIILLGQWVTTEEAHLLKIFSNLSQLEVYTIGIVTLHVSHRHRIG